MYMHCSYAKRALYLSSQLRQEVKKQAYGMIENNLLANDEEACTSRFHKVRLELQVQFEEK